MKKPPVQESERIPRKGAVAAETKQEQSGPVRSIPSWLTLTGGGLILVALPILVPLFIFDLISEKSPFYLGVVFVPLLLLLLLGFLLVPIGMVRQRWKRARGQGGNGKASLVIDFSLPRHRYLAALVLVGGVLILLLMATGSYKVYHATESNAFCGQMCHQVMQPEWTAYQHSSHARVKCVECHIGSGATWFVRSKISGFGQILAVMANTYPKPIPTPVKNLRPARETCEECHWPSRFIGFRESTSTYYLGDEKNTPFKLRMLIKIGGEKSKMAVGSGIHYHMLIASKVEYIARDQKRQEIPWVRIRRSDGSVTEYQNNENPLTEDERQSLELRTMDCMDCHNRPAHKFPVPMKAVNSSMEQQLIPADIPYIKLQATKALSIKYESTSEALAGIANQLRNYYRKNQPELLTTREGDLKKAIMEVQQIYRTSNFPEMKANWAAYPDNIGHRDWPGCFRCHNENMKSSEGFTIFTTCDKCHLILAQGQDIDKAEVNFSKGLLFNHPGDDDLVKDYTECVECHSGGAGVYD